MAVKKLVKKKKSPKQGGITYVGKPIKTIPTVKVFGIDFEQGDFLGFGKCTQKNNYGNREWQFIKWEDHYIVWGRHPDDKLVDFGGIHNEANFLTTYNIIEDNE